MKYYYEKPNEWTGAGIVYRCNHPMYNSCTLFKMEGKGLAVIQERWHEKTKARWWAAIDPWLAGDISCNSGFMDFFSRNADFPDENGIYPTFPVRKVMWELRMKPLRKEVWENWI